MEKLNPKHLLDEFDLDVLINYPLVWSYGLHLFVSSLLPIGLIVIMRQIYIDILGGIIALISSIKGVNSVVSAEVLYWYYGGTILLVLYFIKRIHSGVSGSRSALASDYNINYGVRFERQEYRDFLLCVASISILVLPLFLVAFSSISRISKATVTEELLQDIRVFNAGNVYLRFLSNDEYAIKLVSATLDSRIVADSSELMYFSSYGTIEEDLERFLVSRFRAGDKNAIKTDLYEQLRLYARYSYGMRDVDSLLVDNGINLDVVANDVLIRFHDLESVCSEAYRDFYEDKDENITQSQRIWMEYFNTVQQEIETKHIVPDESAYVDFLAGDIETELHLTTSLITKEFLDRHYDPEQLFLWVLFFILLVAAIRFGFRYMSKTLKERLNVFTGGIAVLATIVLICVAVVDALDDNNKILSNTYDFFIHDSYFHLFVGYLAILIFLISVFVVSFRSSSKCRTSHTTPELYVFFLNALLPCFPLLLVYLLIQSDVVLVDTEGLYSLFAVLGGVIYVVALPWIVNCFLRISSLPFKDKQG